MKTLISREYVNKFRDMFFENLYKKCINQQSPFNGITYHRLYKETVREIYPQFKMIMEKQNIETELVFRYNIDVPFSKKIIGNLNYYLEEMKIIPEDLKEKYEKYSKENIGHILSSIKNEELNKIIKHMSDYNSNFKDKVNRLRIFEDEIVKFFNTLLFDGCYLYIKDNDESRIYFLNKYLDVTPISAKNFIDFFGLKFLSRCYEKSSSYSYLFLQDNPFQNKSYIEETHHELIENLLSEKLKNFILSVNEIIEKHGFRNTYYDEKKYFCDNYFSIKKNNEEKVYYRKNEFINSHKILFNIGNVIPTYFADVSFSIAIHSSIMTYGNTMVKISVYNSRCKDYCYSGEIEYHSKIFHCLNEIQNSKKVQHYLNEIINAKKEAQKQKYKIIKKKYEDMLKHGITGFCVKEKYSDDKNKLVAPYYEKLFIKIE